EHAQGAAADQAAREGGLLEQDEAVQRVAVLAEGPLDEAVIIGIARCGEEHPVEPDATVVVVHLVLVPIPARDLDGHVEFHDSRSVAPAPWGTGNDPDTISWGAWR